MKEFTHRVLTRSRPVLPLGEQHPWLLRLFSLSIAAMPMSFASSGQAKLLPFAILVIGGAWLLCVPYFRSEYAKTRAVTLAVMLAALVAFINVAWHGPQKASLGLHPQMLVFLLTAVPFLLPVNRRLIWFGFGVCALTLGIVAIVQCHFLGEHRAHGLNGGPWAAIEYGMFMLVMCLLSIHRLLQTHTPSFERYFHAVCALVALYGVLLTESRGPLLAFPVALIVMMALHARRYRHRRLSTWVLTAALLIVTAAASLARPEIINRLNDIQQEVDTLDASSQGAIRERIEMWHVAWQAFADHPVAGVGLGGFGDYSRQQIALGKSSPSIIQYKNPHNEYLEAASTGGIPALVALFSVFAAPLIFFARRLSSANTEQFYASVAGISVVCVYAQCALSNNVFYRAMPHSLYFFLVTGMAMWSVTSIKHRKCIE